MARQRKTAEETTASTDVFDEQIAARQTDAATNGQTLEQAIAEQSNAMGHAAVPAAEVTPQNGSGHAAAVGKRQYKRAEDPFGGHLIDLTNNPKGPKARFLRSNDNGAMLLQFSENPGEEIRSQLKVAGLRWENKAVSDFAKGAWIIDLEPAREWRNHAHAEKIFQDVVNQIRAKNGMEAFVPGAGQSVA